MDQFDQQQQEALQYSVGQWEESTGKISAFNKKVKFATIFIGRIAKKYKPAIYNSYLMELAPTIFEKTFMNESKPNMITVPFITFMTNIAPFMKQIMEKDEHFLFENYKKVDLLAKLPLCEFREISKQDKDQLWNKLHELVSFVNVFQTFCQSTFTQVLENNIRSIPPEYKDQLISSFSKDKMIDTMDKFRNDTNSEKKNAVFQSLQSFIPKEMMEQQFGNSVNSLDDIMSSVQQGLQSIDPSEMEKLQNQMKTMFQ